MVADRFFLDTNVLIGATDPGRPEHDAILRAFNDDWPQQGTTLYTSGQVLREYLVVTTRPTEANGLGLDPGSASANIAEFRRRMMFLEETEKVAVRLDSLVSESAIHGKRIHDANIVATMLVHGIQVLLTLNPRDFAPFCDLVDIRNTAWTTSG